MSKLKNKFKKRMMTKEQVYIIPTASGLKYLFINFLLFLIALSFAHNMSLIVNFIMLAYFIIQMLETHKIIYDAKINSLHVENNFSGDPLEIFCFLEKISPSTSLIQLQLIHNEIHKEAYLESSQKNHCSFILKYLNRGHYKGEKIKISTKGHSKLFYVWRYKKINFDFYVYPAPKKIHLNSNILRSHFSFNGELSFKEHIKYQIPAPSHRIDWKLYAKSLILYQREYTIQDTNNVELNYNFLPGEKEEKLSYLSYLINYCFKHQIRWSLILPNSSLKLGRHYHKIYEQSLEAISVF